MNATNVCTSTNSSFSGVPEPPADFTSATEKCKTAFLYAGEQKPREEDIVKTTMYVEIESDSKHRRERDEKDREKKRKRGYDSCSR